MLWKVMLVLAILIGSIVALLRVESLSIRLNNPDDDRTTAAKGSAKENVPSISTAVRTAYTAKLTILSGELPGYTGWSRPASTLAHYFEVSTVSSSAPVAGTNWTVQVHCHDKKARAGGAAFYVRAYGRAILPGLVTDHRNGTYDVTILPLDAGRYNLEVVLIFSQPPAWDALPVEDPPGYEGYLLKGFPIELDVVAGDSPSMVSQVSRLCNTSELLETSPTSALQNGRWLVKHKNVDDPFTKYNAPTYKGYQNGLNSLGIQMEFVHTNGCSVLSETQALDVNRLYNALAKSKLEPKTIHIIFLGDSNIRNQVQAFQRYFGGRMEASHILTNGGLFDQLPRIREQLQELAAQDKHYFVLFNSGLHDIAQLCVHPNATLGDDLSCAGQYRTKLQEFVHVVHSFPSVLTVWQTTTAAWPKYGVFGNEWTPQSPQRLPKAPNVCQHFNEIAWDVLLPYRIPVMDTYWMTLSRPDHRQVDKTNAVAGHLMHAGPEVYSILTRRWAMMIIEAIAGAGGGHG
jgi:hypothetical protein